MQPITLKELISRNYDTSKISNAKLIECKCVRCSKEFEYVGVKHFMKNRKNKPDKKHLWNTCQKCWLNINTCEDNEWVKRNSEAQLIAQNKPEQKKKNADGVSKSWTKERKLAASNFLKDRWNNDPEFARKGLENINWTQTNNARYQEIMSKSWGSGGLKGIYKNIIYDSALELSFILWCEENLIPIKRYDLEAISYIAEDNKNRVYIPDFIINNDTVVEIKGLGLYYKKNFARNQIKLQVLKDWTVKNNMNYRFLLSTDIILKTNYKRAAKLHHEIKKQKENTL